ncbi:hypothetical protein LPJ59_003105 [Coemansia sp. RSA 2399]|nr:hypothetical protein LPJ59_003105 [Coemansia sp. RSA 2399]
MASQHQPSTSSATTPHHEHSRINKVENLLQSQSSRDGTPVIDSEPAAAANTSPYTPTTPVVSSGSSTHSFAHQQSLRRTRPHAATISESSGSQLAALHSLSQAPMPQQSPRQQHQQSQQQPGSRYFHPQTPPQSHQTSHPPLPPPSHFHSQQQLPPPGSPHDARPRRMTFIGTPVSADAHRDHYEMSFSRSTSSHYAPNSQPSPQRPFIASASSSGVPTTQPFSGRPPLYIPSPVQQQQHQQQLPPPPASAPSNQQHFNISSNYHNQQQQQQQSGGRLPPFGHRASYSGGGGGSSSIGPGMPLQRSLSPPPLGRRYLPVPGRYDIGGGSLQRSPLPFPRIPSPKIQQLQHQHQHPPPSHLPHPQRTSPPSATAPLASVVAAANSGNVAAAAHSPVRESTRRLSSVVWGPTGFERLDSGMSRCRICSKEYSKGSSTGTLKRHFRQHQINVGGPGASFSRPSPPATAAAAGAAAAAGGGNVVGRHVPRPRAYSHRTESRSRREVSPFSSPPSARPQQAHAVVAAAAAGPHPMQQGLSPVMVKTESHPRLTTLPPHTLPPPGQFQHQHQHQLQQPSKMRVDSMDMDPSSAIAGSALLSMAAGGDSRMDVDSRPVRRPTRLSDPSVYPASSSAGATTIDPETRDISVSPSPSTATSVHDEVMTDAALAAAAGIRRAQQQQPQQQQGADIGDESDDGIRQHQHKRRRATDASAHSVARTASPGGEALSGLSATELVALSSELMLRVAHALPLLAQEAADGQQQQRLADGCRSGDPLDALFGHIRNRLLLDRMGGGGEGELQLNGSSTAVPSSGSPHNTKTPLLSPRATTPPSSSSALSPFYSLLSIPFAGRDAHHLPYTIRKALPRPVTTATAMTLLSRVSAAMQRIAPLSLAELKWDNVGILLEAAQPRAAASRVFLTVDLTSETLHEALDDPAVGVIVAYHPPIFFAWKSLTMADHKQSLILKCASAGVSIYTPHTSLDSCEDGINDWLASVVGEGKVTPIVAAAPEDAAGQQNAGSGRVIDLATPQPLAAIVSRVKERLNLERIRVARAPCHVGDESSQKLVSRVAVCAGSGYSVVGDTQADLYVTGEMGHHDALAATAKGTSCILGEHSNTERGYLRAVLAKRLQQELDSDGTEGSGEEPASIVVSNLDKDPIVIE